MKTTNKIKLGGLTGALLVSLFSANAFAAHPGYLDDQATGSVVRNSYNECWRTAYFDKAKDGLVECGDAEAKAAPAPVVAVPVKETLSLSAEVLFGFDKSTVTPEGKQALVDVANKIKSKGAKLQGVEVLGYTDYIGTEKYNMALSERRAAAVKNVLVEMGADPAKVREALMGGFAGSKILEVHGERMIKGTFDPGFRISLHQKDLNLALQGAKELGINLPNTSNAQQVFNTCQALGGGNWDHSALIKGLEHMANFSIRDK